MEFKVTEVQAFSRVTVSATMGSWPAPTADPARALARRPDTVGTPANIPARGQTEAGMQAQLAVTALTGVIPFK